ncbi:MAG: hypothetical protein WDO18_21760 [Acidobacteriota bacterium]
MTPDQAKQLLGGYATGSLTEPERKALLEAAVDDQELFDELAREHALKDILALPGAKERLSAALTPPPPAEPEQKKRAWWIFALAGLAGIVLLMWLVVPRKPDAGQVEVASTSKAPQPELVEPIELSPAIDAAAKSDRKKEARETRRETPQPQPVAPSPPQVARSTADAGAMGGFAAGAVTESNIQVRGAPAQAAIAQAKVAPARADAAPVRDGPITYVLTGKGTLKITPTETGSLMVTAGEQVLIGWDPAVAQATVELPVPAGVNELRVQFTAPGQTPSVVRIPIQQ